jgi:hypothetical protein
MIAVRTKSTGVAGSPFYSSFYFDGDGSGGTAATFISLVKNYWQNLAPYLDDAQTVTVDGNVDVLSSVTPFEIDNVLAAGANVDVHGTGTGDSAPTALSLCIKKLTGIRVGGRQIQGHTYVSGLVKSAIDVTGSPTPAFAAAALGATHNLTLSSGHPEVVVSRTHATLAPVQSYVVLTDFSFLRSRRA